MLNSCQCSSTRFYRKQMNFQAQNARFTKEKDPYYIDQQLNQLTIYFVYLHNNISKKSILIKMLCTIITSLVIAFFGYALLAYIRRKITKPDYKGQTVWITGASSGIGEYLAYEFNRCGAYIIISARNTTQLKRVKDNCPNPQQAQFVKLDMTNYKEIEAVTKSVIEKLQKSGKKLDVLVENAGQSMRCQFLHYAFENHLALFDVNVNGPYRHMQVVLPHMIKNKAGQIIGISSQSGKISPAFRTSYSGSKAAFIGIMDSLRSQLRPLGIRVCNILPGYIKTNLSQNALSASAGEKFGKTDENIAHGMQPQNFAREAVAAAYNKENEVSIAKNWSPILGIVMRNICPDLVFRILLHKAKSQSKAEVGEKKE